MRDRKPIAVDKVRSGGHEVDVFYDFRQHTFFFEESGTRARVSAETFTEVRRLLDQSYEKATPLDWRPVILVKIHGAYDDQDHSVRTKKVEGASVHLTFRRCELSPRPDHVECVERITRERKSHESRFGPGGYSDRGPIEREGYIEREHSLDFEAREPSDYDREARAKTLERPDTYDNQAGVVELPYEDDTWRGLLALKAAIDDLHGTVGTLVRSAQFRDCLKRFASRATPPMLVAVSGDMADGVSPPKK